MHPQPLRNLSETDDVLDKVALEQKLRGFNESTGVGPIVKVTDEDKESGGDCPGNNA